MAGIKINQYPLERLTFGDEDYYDIDYWTGSSYETAKIKGSVIKSGIASGLVTLYANDGTLAGDRAVSGAGTNSLAFGNNVLNENLSFFKVNSTQGLEQFASAFPITNAGLEVIKNPANFISTVKSSATDYSQFRLQNAEFIVNSFLGTNNYMHSSTPALSSTIISDGGAGTNSRLLLYGSGRVDLGTTGSVGAYITLDTSNTFTDRNTTPKGLEYTLDYSANYSNRSLVDKEYVDNNAGGDSIYTADGTLTGNRAVDTGNNTLTIDGSGATTSNKKIFVVNKPSGEALSVDEDGDLLVNGSIKNGTYFGVEASQTGYWYHGTIRNIQIGKTSTSTRTKFDQYGTSFFSNSNIELHRIGLTGGGTGQYMSLFKTGFGTAQRFLLGGTTLIGSEDISLQGSTLIKGNGTSTDSALSIYDNDTTPTKLWDFLDNGNVGVSKSSSFLLSANKTLKVDGSSNTNQNIFELNGSTNAFGTGAVTVGAYGNVEIKGTNSAGNFKVLTMLGNEYLTLDGNGNNTTLRTNAFDIGASATTGYKMSFDAGRHQFIRGGVVGAYFNLVNSSVQFWEAGMTSRKFIVGGSALVGTEQISLQGSTLIDGSLDMNNNRISNTIVNPSVQETTSTATFTINADEETTGVLTAMASATTIASPTGTPVQGQSLIIRLKDDGTARAITWNAIFRGIGITLPTTTTANKLLYIGCMYNSTDTKWDIIALKEEA